MVKIRPVVFITYKGYLLHAADPKVKEHSEPEALYTREALEAVASAVYAKVGVALLKEVTDSGFEKLRSIDLDAIINDMTEE